MSDEPLVDALEELVTGEESQAGSDEPARSSSNGLGFRVGMLVGALAGAVAARLLTPRMEAGQPASMAGTDARLEGPLASLRSRLYDASLEAQEASGEAEQRLEQRYRDLTDKEA